MIKITKTIFLSLLLFFYVPGINFNASPPVPTGELPGGPASFVMRQSKCAC